jgi:transcriptional regulator with XRE-family HTH domain
MERKKPSPTTPSLGATIRAGRKAAGLTLRDCAKLVGVHYSYLARLESGEYDRPGPETLQRLAETLELDASELFAFIGVKPVLPEPKMFFRRAYGMSEAEAAEAADIIENLRIHQREQQYKEGRNHDNTNQSGDD